MFVWTMELSDLCPFSIVARTISLPHLWPPMPADWQQVHPPEISAHHQGGPVMSLYGGSFAPQQPPPPPGDIKHPATCPPPLPALRRLPNCPVRGQAELTKWDLTGVSLLGTGWSGRCQLSTHAPRLLLPQCSRGQWPGSRGVRVCLGLGQMNHTVNHNPGTLPFYDSEVNPASR